MSSHVQERPLRTEEDEKNYTHKKCKKPVIREGGHGSNSASRVSTSEKGKKRINPARIEPALSYELFGTDSEGEDRNSDDSDGVRCESPKIHKVGKHGSKEPHSSELEQPKRKKSKVNIITPTTASHTTPADVNRKESARDVFGTDTEDDEVDEQALRPVHPVSALIPEYELMNCENCKIEMSRKEYSSHLKTNLHKSNCLLNTEFDNIYMIATAFKNRIVSYRINPSQKVDYFTPEIFFNECQKDLIKLINISVESLTCIKVNFEFFVYFIQPHSDKQELKSFNTKYETVYKSTDFNELLLNTSNTLKKKLTEFELRESGWTYLSISHIEINMNKYSPLRGGSYIPLPPAVRSSKSCISIQNSDNHCFLWSIMAGLFPSTRNVCKVSSYPHYSSVLNTEGMSFPPSPKQIELFEKNNPNISVNIYGLDNKSKVTGPLYKTKKREINHINLLYIERGGKAHYCLIKDLVRLVRRQVSHHKGKIYLCETCLQFYNDETKYRSHDCSDVLVTLPKINSVLKFEHYERQQKLNFVIYADFECLLSNHTENISENTKILKKHRPSCFAYYIRCSYDDQLNKFVTYRGEDCVEIFVKRIIKDVKRLHKILSNVKPMTPLTAEQESSYQNATYCHICKQHLFGDKVRDHDHVTSMYRGPAHSHCNLMHRVCPFIPVVFHNLSGYDSHLFIEELVKQEGSVKIIPQTKEKYLSITKYIKTDTNSRSIQIKFIDSYQFMSSSLDALSKSLSENDFVNLSREFPDKNQRELLYKKGVYPYDYMNSCFKFSETELPLKSCFYNSLNDSHITEAEYERARTIWNVFNIKSLGEYTDLYLKSDVLLLCDIFEKFRMTSLHYYNLDPAYYITSPSLSWDAMLLYTQVELELISDLEIYQMLEKGIRGGLAQCSLRHAKANNKYMSDFNDAEPSSYLIYLDCNNLYGYAMMQRFPISEFKFLSQNEIETIDVLSIPANNDYGYILEVDLAYPDHLHSKHSDLPFAAEKFIPPGGKCAKLIANLYDKFNYIIHYTHLKDCLKHGLVLNKIHRILSFRQENYLKKYIDLNTTLRQAAKTEYEKNHFKLSNNAIFGKTLQNNRNQIDVKLVTKWKDNENVTNKHLTAEKLISKPNFKSVTIFSENFVGIQLNHEKIVLDRPIYIGFTVLELAKQHLYQFHYDYIKNKFKNDVHLCYTDTDSLLYLIYTEDFYQEMYCDISKFDTSNFAINNPYNIPKVNEKIPGIFKDEMGGDVITEFVGLRAKLYYIKSENSAIKKAKGISKYISKRLTLNDYNMALIADKQLRCKMNMIRSIKHVLYSQQVDKQVLNRSDDKRQVLRDQIHTLPWGHCETIF